MIPKRQAFEIANSTLLECCLRFNLGEKKFSRGARQWIMQRKWNDSTDLQKSVYFAVLTSHSDLIERGHFPLRFPRDHEAFTNAQIADIGLSELVKQKFAHFLTRLEGQEVEGVYPAILQQVEKALFELAYKRSGTSKSKMARILGVHRNTIRRKVKEFGFK